MSKTLIPSSRGAYEVHVAPGLLQSAGEMCGQLLKTRRVLVVADDEVTATHARTVVEGLQASGLTVSMVSIRAAEIRKTIEVVAQIWSHAMSAGIERSDALVVVGGGLVGDVGGFAAASWLRGVDVVQIPTTLLAMVDASVGGKTAVNVPLPDSVGGGLGKNMAGAFWPPRLVLADPETLQTLPSRHISCGLAEAVKHGLLADPDLLDLIERMGPALVKGSLDGAETIISRAVSIKADIVARDELESGQRALLNLGHTFAHAIEGRPALGLHHGEAVAIGLMAAGALGVQLETMASDALDRLRSLLASLSLPVILPGPCPADQLLERMRFDKKMDQGTMRLIVPQAPCGACIRTDVSDAQVLEAWRSVGAS